jgi:O-antigen/teichoic acid export membrane protein
VNDKVRRSFRWIAWWYAAIAIGFALLAIEHLVTGDKLWLVGVRLIIALGFAFLAAMEFKTKKLKR